MPVCMCVCAYYCCVWSTFRSSFNVSKQRQKLCIYSNYRILVLLLLLLLPLLLLGLLCFGRLSLSFAQRVEKREGQRHQQHAFFSYVNNASAMEKLYLVVFTLSTRSLSLCVYIACVVPVSLFFAKQTNRAGSTAILVCMSVVRSFVWLCLYWCYVYYVFGIAYVQHS